MPGQEAHCRREYHFPERTDFCTIPVNWESTTLPSGATLAPWWPALAGHVAGFGR